MARMESRCSRDSAPQSQLPAETGDGVTAPILLPDKSHHIKLSINKLQYNQKVPFRHYL